MKERHRNRFFELQTDFLIPLWRRVALVALCIVWAVFEFVSGAPFWGVIFAGAGGYAVWQLFFDGWPGEDAGRGGD